MKLHGVFIGINKYSDPRISSLRYAKTDAEQFYWAVTKSGLTSDQINIQLLTDAEATRPAVLRAIGEVLPRTVRDQDLVILYFSGHGSPETSAVPDGVSRYLITHDVDYANVFSTALDMERDLSRLIERIPSALIIVILDTCFSGRGGGRTFEGPLLRQSRTGWRISTRLSELNLGEGRVIMAACDDDEVAYEELSLGHGVFTYYLLRALTAQDTLDISVGISSLYDTVAQQVNTFTQGRQNPVLNGRVSLARLPLLRADGEE